MQPLKFGVVGVGGMGGGHTRALAQIEEAELVAVSDVNEDIVQKVAQETGAKAFTDYKQMIRRAGLDAVIVATPHYFHPPMTEYAARHGVPVLCEKPIAVSVAAADKMLAACRKAGVLLGVMFQQRTDPSRHKMRQMVADGVLGALHRVSMVVPWYRTQAYYDSGAWRGTWKGEGGGVLMNQAPHSLDLFVWVGGLPRAVQAIATTRLHAIEVENTALAICDYGDGKVGSFYASTAEAAVGERLEAVGEKGALVWESGKLRHFALERSIADHLRTATGSFESVKGEWQDVPVEDAPSGHAEVIKAFARAVRENDPSLMIADGEDGLRALELANAILLAGYTHREVSLPLNRRRFEGMLKKLQSGTAVSEFYEVK